MAADVLQFPKGASAGAVKPRAAEQPYEWAPGFEAALVHLTCTSADVYAKVGALLEPKCLSTKAATLAVTAAQAIGTDLGRGPVSTVVVLQRLARWRDEGKVSHEQLNEVCALFDAAEDAGLPPPEAVLAEAAEVIKRRDSLRFVQRSMDIHAKHGDFNELAKEAARIAAIGTQAHTGGLVLDLAAFAAVKRINELNKVSTGCLEFDAVTLGGLPIGYTMFIGKEKAGKSLVLASLAASAWLQGGNVALATLELDEEWQVARVLSNLTGVPTRFIADGTRLKEAETLYGEQFAKHVGSLRVRYFEPDTPAEQITTWFDEVAESTGRPLTLGVVDYSDLVGAPGGGAVGKTSGDYGAQKLVMRHLRGHARTHKYAGVSAAQATRGKSEDGELDLDQVADSKHKTRIPDLVIAMRMGADDKDFVDYYVAAARNGKDRQGTGKLPVDRDRCRMFPTPSQKANIAASPLDEEIPY